MELNVLFEPKIDLPRLSQVLDELGHEGRVHSIRLWNRDQQAALFEAASGFRPLALADLVPPSVASKVEVIHHLKNSLPVASHGEKRMCRADDEGKLLWGYNEQSFAFLTGPGYFVVRASAIEGEVIFDYRETPAGKPDAWPPLAPNTSLGARPVFGSLVDHVRAVSSHVVVGRAQRAKGRAPGGMGKAEGEMGKWMDAWFVLCREDRAG